MYNRTKELYKQIEDTQKYKLLYTYKNNIFNKKEINML